MKKKSIRAALFALSALMLLSALSGLALPVAANSAQSWFSGVSSTGAIMPDGESPIVVEREVLTFDIPCFPEPHFADEWLGEYDARVTAEYTFYNPSEYTVKSKLLFPFGNKPDYIYGDTDDTDKFDIKVNGAAVEKRIRHTLSDPYAEFDVDQELAMICEGFAPDDFYSPELSVTRYTFRLEGFNKGPYPAANIGFDVKKGVGDRRIYWPEQNGMHMQPDGDMRIHTSVRRGETELTLYVIGAPLDTMPEWKIYVDGGVSDAEVVPLGEVSLVKTQSTSLLEFALAERGENSPITESDWYNALIDELRLSMVQTGGEHPVVECPRFEGNFEQYFMRWYEYELTFEPYSRIVNSVTAPMYPAIDLDYEPDLFEYTYLLSPAKTWREFGALEIVINTPYYVCGGGIEGLARTDNGYRAELDGLPEGELVFSLSEAERPALEASPYAAAFFILIASIIGGIVLIAAGVGVFVLAVIAAGVGVFVLAVILLIVLLLKKNKKGI